MDDKRLIKTSKYLSRHLRHEPQRLGLTLQPGHAFFVSDNGVWLTDAVPAAYLTRSPPA